jgi:hypothetical protein
MSLKIKMAVDVPENLLSEILVTAFDGDCGGCWFWAEPYMETSEDDWLKTDDFATDPSWLSAKIIDKEDSSNGPWTVDHSTLVRGMQQILDADYGHSETLRKLQGYIREAVIDDDGSMLDAYAVDTIVQLGLFTEEVYG